MCLVERSPSREERAREDNKMKNNLRKTVAFVAASLLAIVPLAACSSESPNVETSATSTTSAETTGAVNGSESRTVIDAYGREVELPQVVETSASVGSAARFAVYAGAADKLIAVTEMDTPSSPLRPYTVVHEKLFSSLPTTSNGNHLLETAVDEEALLGLNPDVVISSRSADECDLLQDTTGIPVVCISYQNQIFSDDVYKSIEVIGETLGTEDHASEVVAQMKGWEEDLDSRTSAVEEDDKPSVYVGAVNFKGAKSFGGTYQQYAPFVVSNIKNVADELGGHGSVDIDLEQLGRWDPDIIFLNPSNMDLMKKDYADNAAFFNQLTAFQNGEIYTQPAFNFNGTNVEMGIANAYFAAATVYPEKFEDVDLTEKYDEIFRTMLGSEYYSHMRELGMDFTTLDFS